ncbi:MAG TPA: tRNA 2-thiouridine(34) synthase MnmA [Gemmatimonadota bacterium]|jgi:tRNA-specific 2-thiouridylase|nr:tRNA 2-thiouridine(34) synthase MnmA [Gemmatimonadota bacterium]
MIAIRDTWQDVAPGTRVVVAMSGGVDSSVAAALLVERGCDVVGITMKNFCYSHVPEELSASACCSLEAIEDARGVARSLGIPHHVLDFEGPFREAVIDPFVEEYAAGRTPNPCVRCNRFVRFPQLWRKARLLGAEFVATGHYARAVRGCGADFRDEVTDFRDREGDGMRGEVAILRPADRAKDQTFYLWGLGRPLLERALFPLGGLSKTDVRARAGELGFAVAEKPESQDICFIPDGDLRGFLERQRAERPELASDRFAPGPVLSTRGELLGTHAGSAFLTVGQRRGVGVTAERPLYVTAFAAGNTVVVGGEEELYSHDLEAEDANWLVEPPREPIAVQAQIRYRSAAAPARLIPGSSRSVRLRFDAPQRAIAPGQSVVFYDGDRLLGGATIIGR